jgi:broad specificity phosphatase PhoE
MKIYLIRHGETDWNVQGKLQGREDIPMNSNGIAQSKHCGNVLKDENITAVISSPLNRARKTAEIIAECLSLQDVIIDEELTERDFGNISGMTWKEREALRALGKKEYIEPWNQLCERLMICLEKLFTKYQSKNVAVVSHGASINAILSMLSNGNIGTGKTWLKNTCINVIEHKEGKTEIMLHNVTPDEFKELDNY